MNAHKVADDLQECIDDGSTDLVCVQEAAILIRQQKDELDKVVPQLVKANGLIENLRLRIAELEKELAFMEGEYPEPTIAAKILEFASLEQAYNKITELEKKLQESAMDYISICSQADEHYARAKKLEQTLQAIANDYHELSDHKIEVQNRNHKKWAREALE